jgi:iron(III) transport system permease protein
VSSLGYAIPGAVLAIGIIIPFAWFDNQLDAFMRSTFGISTGLVLSGTAFAVLFAYLVRFLAVASGSIESSLDKVTPNMDMASRSLGHSYMGTLTRIHLPIIRRGALTAMLVVFVDCMKELPATLILRPFNFETLATQVYQFASDELLEQSALSALVIVLVGIIPVILLDKTISKQDT